MSVVTENVVGKCKVLNTPHYTITNSPVFGEFITHAKDRSIVFENNCLYASNGYILEIVEKGRPLTGRFSIGVSEQQTVLSVGSDIDDVRGNGNKSYTLILTRPKDNNVASNHMFFNNVASDIITGIGIGAVSIIFGYTLGYAAVSICDYITK